MLHTYKRKMRKEVIYNAKYEVVLEDGSIWKRETGFYALGRTAFIDQINFMHRPLKVNFKKIWTEEPIDTQSLSYVEY